MTDKICTAGRGVTCVHKRNVKPHIACVFTDKCIYQEQVTQEEHGSKLVKAMQEVN